MDGIVAHSKRKTEKSAGFPNMKDLGDPNERTSIDSFRGQA